MSRKIITINNDWEFKLGDKCHNVNLPHSAEITPINSSGCLNYQGEYSYSKKIKFEQNDKKIILTFFGIMGTSKLMINNKLVKEHFCSYTPLVCDVTDVVLSGEENLIEIHADNSDDMTVPVGKPQEDLDFSYEAGMYRDVTITYTDKLYITNELLEQQVAGGGVYFYTTKASEDNAQTHAKVHIKNETDSKKQFTLKGELVDENNVAISVQSEQLSLDVGSDIHHTLDMNIDNPKLWSPNKPNMYELVVSVICDDVIVDKYTFDIGIRVFEFTAKNGILINGESYRLSGGNYHQTFPHIGNAMSNNLQKRDVIKLARIQTKSIRGHYPFSNTFTQECDRHGIALIVSNPGWQFFNGEQKFVENAYRNMRDIIRWKRNHASVILWEHILNETMLPDEFVKTLYDIVHTELPYTNTYCGADHGLADVHYKGYDHGMLSPDMDTYGGEQGKVNLHWVREYGDTPDDWHNQHCAWRSPRWMGDYAMVKSISRMLGKDNQNQYENYIDVYNNESICGYGIWPLIEHNRGYHINPCYGGHMDLFRIPKFSYNFMKSQITAQSSEEIELFIANWATEVSPNDVTILSNADSVKLYFDDKLIGEQKPDDVAVKHPPFTFKNVINENRGRERFTLKAEAIFNGEVVAVSKIKSPGVPKKLELVADLEGIQPVADGSDIFVVHCKVVDIEGNVTPQMADRTPIFFEVSGEGELVADENDLAKTNPVYPNAGICSILVRTTQRAGQIKIKADFLWSNHGVKCGIEPTEIFVSSIDLEK